MGQEHGLLILLTLPQAACPWLCCHRVFSQRHLRKEKSDSPNTEAAAARPPETTPAVLLPTVPPAGAEAPVPSASSQLGPQQVSESLLAQPLSSTLKNHQPRACPGWHRKPSWKQKWEETHAVLPSVPWGPALGLLQSVAQPAAQHRAKAGSLGLRASQGRRTLKKVG